MGELKKGLHAEIDLPMLGGFAVNWCAYVGWGWKPAYVEVIFWELK